MVVSEATNRMLRLHGSHRMLFGYVSMRAQTGRIAVWCTKRQRGYLSEARTIDVTTPPSSLSLCMWNVWRRTYERHCGYRSTRTNVHSRSVGSVRKHGLCVDCNMEEMYDTVTLTLLYNPPHRHTHKRNTHTHFYVDRCTLCHCKTVRIKALYIMYVRCYGKNERPARA